MSAPAPVVVAVDGTDDGRRALQYGIAVATRSGAPLRLVHVRHDNVVLAPPMLMPLLPDPTLDEIAARVLREALDDTRRMGWKGDEPETVVARAPRAPAIVDNARDARCVVLGTRSGSAQHLLTGSTTNGVAAHSDVPVFCVPPTWEADTEAHRVCVGVDCSESSVPLVEAAAVTAGELGARVVVLHAWRPFAQYDAAISERTFEERWEEQTRPFLDKIVDNVTASHPDVVIDVELRFERPVVALHELSQTCDLVVIGRHGHHARLSPRLGTTARTVIRTSASPVLVVPTQRRA